MLGAVAIPVGILVGVIVIWALGVPDAARLKSSVLAAEAKGSKDSAGGSASGAALDPRASGQVARFSLDMCFLAFIVLATASILVYELKVDPLVELNRMLPTEGKVLSEFWQHVRDDWLSSFFQAPARPA